MYLWLWSELSLLRHTVSVEWLNYVQWVNFQPAFCCAWKPSVRVTCDMQKFVGAWQTSPPFLRKLIIQWICVVMPVTCTLVSYLSRFAIQTWVAWCLLKLLKGWCVAALTNLVDTHSLWGGWRAPPHSGFTWPNPQALTNKNQYFDSKPLWLVVELSLVSLYPSSWLLSHALLDSPRVLTCYNILLHYFLSYYFLFLSVLISFLFPSHLAFLYIMR